MIGKAIKGHRFEDPERHGKWLICPTEAPIMIFHFGMTGKLVRASRSQDEHPHDRLVLHFDDGELRYRAMRKLGGVWLARSRGEVSEVIGPLGPDAFGLSQAELVDRLAGRRGGIKSALMDQSLVAGLGSPNEEGLPSKLTCFTVHSDRMSSTASSSISSVVLNAGHLSASPCSLRFSLVPHRERIAPGHQCGMSPLRGQRWRWSHR